MIGALTIAPRKPTSSPTPGDRKALRRCGRHVVSISNKLHDGVGSLPQKLLFVLGHCSSPVYSLRNSAAYRRFFFEPIIVGMPM
jgi:hypothetical protein